MVEKNPQTILVYVGLDLVGDGLLKLPFIRALRAAYPAAKITWLAGKGKSVFSGFLSPLVIGLIDEVIDEIPVGSRFGELFTPPLKGRHFDLIIDTQRRVLTTLILKRISHNQFISGTGNYLFSSQKPSSKDIASPSMVGAMLELVDVAKGEKVRPVGTLEIDEIYTKGAAELLPDGFDYIGLSPGAGGKHKCWPQERFIELANQLVGEGKTPVILLGPAEEEWIEKFKIPQVLLPLQTGTAKSLNQSP
ncbi:MAG: lipopolysaccharide heptosyltransferase family protein, partial [Alphaproteobacteria bacterium]|nr:lipopolysaccharide heptosyltransferase family protein [Alphaproteobacteria bacterium]